MAVERRAVEVWADWAGLPSAWRVGLLYATPSRGKEVFSFEYDAQWLEAGHPLSLDPSLQLVRGPQYAPASAENFGVFLDSSPDRWGSRIHFASAMTLLQRRDGEGGSYLDLVELIAQRGAQPARDLEQLWRRIAFFVCVSNVDDHLRNHGFLLEPTGWSLAPAYDLNPVATAGGLTLNISETDNAQDLELVREVAKHFRLAARRAGEVLDEVVSAVKRWRAEAKKLGLSREEQERMASAFQIADEA